MRVGAEDTLSLFLYGSAVLPRRKMSAVEGMHLAAFATEYASLLARARESSAGFSPLLRALAEPLLPQWGASSFSWVVAPLPFWVNDLLDELDAPTDNRSVPPPDEVRPLGLAYLLGWWAYLLQDELLDRDLDRVDLIPLSMTLHATAVRLLQGLLPGHQGFWDAFRALSLTMAEAHSWEQRFDLQALAHLESRGLAPEPCQLNDLERLADRSTLLHLAAIGSLSLRGYPRSHPLGLSLTGMLRHYAIAQQIGDDRADCLEDLRKGRLNYVSACIVRRMREANVIQSYAELDADWLAG